MPINSVAATRTDILVTGAGALSSAVLHSSCGFLAERSASAL